MIVLLDNYDSFSYNLVQALAALGAEVQVHRNDAVTTGDIAALDPSGIVVSPGPHGPESAGICADVVRELAGRCPILGVCLGHQLIATVYGGRVQRAPRPVHGKPADVEHDGKGVFDGLPNPLRVGRYHSLAVVEASVPRELEVSARSGDGVVMGLRHRSLAIEGVQFHPESILTPDGDLLLANFLRLCGDWAAAGARA